MSKAQLNVNQKSSKKRKIHGTKEVTLFTQQMNAETIILRLVFILPNFNGDPRIEK